MAYGAGGLKFWVGQVPEPASRSLVKHTSKTRPGTLRIRKLREQDILTCAKLVAAIPLWQRYRYDELRCARDLRAALKRRDRLTVALWEGTIAGLAWVLPQGGFGRIPYLKLLGVRTEARNLGVGAALLRAAEREGDLLLLVSDFNRRAQRFYAAMDYRRIGSIPDLVLPGVTEIILLKRAAAAIASSHRPRRVRRAVGLPAAARSRAR